MFPLLLLVCKKLHVSTIYRWAFASILWDVYSVMLKTVQGHVKCPVYSYWFTQPDTQWFQYFVHHISVISASDDLVCRIHNRFQYFVHPMSAISASEYGSTEFTFCNNCIISHLCVLSYLQNFSCINDFIFSVCIEAEK